MAENDLLFLLDKNNKWGAFNKELEIVVPFEYDGYYTPLLFDTHGVYSLLIKGDDYELMNQETFEIIPAGGVLDEEPSRTPFPIN